VSFICVPKSAKKESLSIETAARNARYAFYEKATAQYRLNKIALAHHLDDQAETVILNLARGSGLKGLCGMNPFRAPNYIRPFLNLAKSDIESYAKKNNIRFRYDKTNDDVAYLRNKVRHDVLNELKHLNTNVAKNIKRTSDILRQDEEYFDYAVNKEYQKRVTKADDEVVIDLYNWESLHISIQRRLIRKALMQNYSLIDVEFIHIAYIINISKNISGKRIDFGDGMHAAKAYGKLYLFKKQKHDDFTKQLIIKTNQSFTINRYLFNTKIDESKEMIKNSEAFDLEKLEKPVFRYPEKNDFIIPLGMEGKKKLTDYLCDKKIPLHQRENLIVLAQDSEVIWVVGVGISERFKLRGDTKKAFRISYNKRIFD